MSTNKRDYVNSTVERRRAKRPRYFRQDKWYGRLINPVLEFIHTNKQFRIAMAYLFFSMVWVAILYLSEI